MVLPSMRVDGKAALVTGAGSGLGKAIAMALAEAGADCAVTELPEKMKSLDPVCAAIQASGRKAVALPLRLPDMGSIDATVRGAAAGLGAIDILVNNAGVNIPRPALEVEPEDWDTVLDTNL